MINKLNKMELNINTMVKLINNNNFKKQWKEQLVKAIYKDKQFLKIKTHKLKIILILWKNLKMINMSHGGIFQHGLFNNVKK